MRKLFFLLLLLPVIISCEEEIVDERDAFIGTWDMEIVGNLLLLQDNELAYSLPLSNNLEIEISKFGPFGNEMMIGTRMICKLSGNKLSFEPESTVQSTNGLTLQLRITKSGVASNSIITIKESYTGVWLTSSEKGAISGSSNYTFIKK